MVFCLVVEVLGLLVVIVVVVVSLLIMGNDVCWLVEWLIVVLLINGMCDLINFYFGGKVSLFGFGDWGVVCLILDLVCWWVGLNGIVVLLDVVLLICFGLVWIEC